MASPSESVDFFVSYAHEDQEWAEWIAWQVEAAGHTTLVQAWDFTPGRDWVHEMQEGISRARRTILVLTPTYLARSKFGASEWHAGFVKDPLGESASLIPVRVVDCTPRGLLATRVYIDLVGLSKKAAAVRLIEGIGFGRAKPARMPRFPAGTSVERVSSTPSTAEGSDSLAAGCFSYSLSRLLSLQYPWGEWSDHRTELESRIAERQPRNSMEVPKPNVARTLFAIEAIGQGASPILVGARDRALKWMAGGLKDGWYWEWQSVATAHSESTVPELRKRADIRHTAQVAGAVARWGKSHESLNSHIDSLTSSALGDSGFWPDTPGSREPRILATTYSLETLGYLISDEFKPGLEHVVGKQRASTARRVFRRGLAALLSDVEAGDGLLGAANGSKANPYLSSLTLLRLAPLASVSTDVAELIQRLTDGLSTSANEWGWEDESVHENLRPLTRNRTTLRAAAGLSRAAKNGMTVAPSVLRLVRSRVIALTTSSAGWPLDSPDLACSLICLREFEPTLEIDSIAETLGPDIERMRSQNLREWADSTSDLVVGLSFGRELGIYGYDEAWSEVSTRLFDLRSASNM